MPVYFLEIHPPMGNDRKQSALYVGSAKDDLNLERRVKCHSWGCGATITRKAIESGRTITVIAVFPGDRELEQKIKRYRNHRRWLDRHFIDHDGYVPSWLVR